MKILFMGTPEFAVPSLKILIENGHEICGVFTKPDKPQGRKMIITPPPVKVYAQEHGLSVYQPEKLKTPEAFEIIEKLNPELIVVVAYGKILPKNIIDFPKYGCINVHGSLLPKYRGAAPIQWSIINGDKITGITTMYMNEGLDTGDILLQSKVFIGDDETSEELKARLSIIGADLLLGTLKKLENNELAPIPQNDDEASLSPPLDKITGDIDWKMPAQDIHNLVRGSNPWPIAHTLLREKLFKIYKTKVKGFKLCNIPGKVINIDPLTICCGDNTCLELVEVQIAGKKRMPAADFARGYRLSEQTILGK